MPTLGGYRPLWESSRAHGIIHNKVYTPLGFIALPRDDLGKGLDPLRNQYVTAR